MGEVGGGDVLSFGSSWTTLGLVPTPGEAAERRPNLDTRTLNDRFDLFAGYQLRMRWREDRYQRLRNAAWLVRNSHTGQENNPLALGLVLGEAERLMSTGESLYDVLEALAELLMRP